MIWYWFTLLRKLWLAQNFKKTGGTLFMCSLFLLCRCRHSLNNIFHIFPSARFPLWRQFFLLLPLHQLIIVLCSSQLWIYSRLELWVRVQVHHSILQWHNLLPYLICLRGMQPAWHHVLHVLFHPLLIYLLLDALRQIFYSLLWLFFAATCWILISFVQSCTPHWMVLRILSGYHHHH